MDAGGAAATLQAALDDWENVAPRLRALAEDVESLTGFDEGPIPRDWEKQFERRGISVRGGILRDEACEVLRFYRESGGAVYNSKHVKESI